MRDMNKPMVAVSQIEARYALEPFGRDLELVHLMGDELPHLAEQFCKEFCHQSPSMSHHLFKQGTTYLIQLLVQRNHCLEQFSIFLNLSESAFLIQTKDKSYSLISAKGVGQVLKKIIFANGQDGNAEPTPSGTELAYS